MGGRHSTALLLACALVACADSDTETGVSTSVVDGVEVVTARGPDRHDSVEVAFRFGSIEGDPDVLFARILDVALEEDGSLWVVDRNPAVRRYSTDGSLLESLGARGGGPGETNRGFGRVYPGEEGILLLAYDPKLMLFDQDRELVSDTRPILESGMSALPVGASGEGWIYQMNVLPAGEGASRGSWVFGTMSLETLAFDTIVTRPGAMWVRGPTNSGGFSESSRGAFFDGQPSADVGPPGTIYYSDPIEYEISVFDSSGSPTRVFRRDAPETPIPSGLESRIREGVRAGLEEMMGGRTPDPDEVERITAKSLPVLEPDHVPFIESVMVSADGHIWVLRADRHPDMALRSVAASFGYVRSAWLPAWRAPQIFDRFSPSGAYLGSVELPTEFVPMDVTSDLIVGLIRDDLDVEYVTGFRVLR